MCFVWVNRQYTASVGDKLPIVKTNEKEKAILLRKKGKTYSEILSEIPVAKSTLSEWLKSVHLAKPQKQRITKKRIDAALRGAQARRSKRISEVRRLAEEGKKEAGKLSKRELWLVGTALHWAEGSKQNTRSPSAGLIFGNSDYRMLLIFLKWLKEVRVAKKEIRYELYVHVDREKDILTFRKWWAHKLRLSVADIHRVYLKPGNPKTKRSNVGDLYHGLLRIRVRSSTILNRRVNGWKEGIVASVGSSVTGNTSGFEPEDSRIVP